LLICVPPAGDCYTLAVSSDFDDLDGWCVTGERALFTTWRWAQPQVTPVSVEKRQKVNPSLPDRRRFLSLGAGLAAGFVIEPTLRDQRDLPALTLKDASELLRTEWHRRHPKVAAV
jgi:hypothetical protein